MLIINADDWGRSVSETNAALTCFRHGRITSVTAMMFMHDSERAAQLAKEHQVPAGLHLNLNQTYTRAFRSKARESHDCVARFLNRNKFSVLLYHPGLRRAFREVFNDQMEEFTRLYGKPPTHVDGHQHRHLCANVLIDGVIPCGQKVRRNFSFWPGEKSLLNRTCRSWTDKWLSRRYRLTDFFFSLAQCLKAQRLGRVSELAATANVELMTHPVQPDEYTWLMGDSYPDTLRGVKTAPYALL